MSNIFSLKEVFEMAEQIERNGVKFYQEAAQNAESKELRKFLSDFAIMETEHISSFKDMASKYANDDNRNFIDPTDTAMLYIDAMVNGCIFNDTTIPYSSIKSDDTVEIIFSKAIALEKDAIAFYTGMRECFSKPEDKKAIDDIIIEEMGHVVLLKNQYDQTKV